MSQGKGNEEQGIPESDPRMQDPEFRLRHERYNAWDKIHRTQVRIRAIYAEQKKREKLAKARG